MAWMQASALGHFMRESSRWTYAIVNLTHIFGIGLLFGSVVILDLRLLGAWRRTSLAAITDVAAPVAFCGFAIAATTGVGLLATKATEYRSEEHTSELQSHSDLVCRLLLEKNKRRN